MSTQTASTTVAADAPEAQVEEVHHQRARPIPRISIQAFCETGETAEAMQIASDDRRLAKAHVSVHLGGAAAAITHYESSPTPNLIIVESTLPRNDLLAQLDHLAEFCDAGTKVLIIGHKNDVLLYRELLKRGVSEYLIAPASPIQIMESVSNLYTGADAGPIGLVYAFVGAKGGVGSSTICHNVSWCISELLKANVVIADLDLAFGTAGLDFNQDPVQGIAEALGSPERLDEVLLDRLLTKCSDHLSIFAAPGTLDREAEINPDACEVVLDVVRQSIPFVTVDLPHVWTYWSKRILSQADGIVITAAPDLANLRNAKNLVDLLRQTRHNDRPPMLVINMANTLKRPEIPIKDFEAALDMKAVAVVDTDYELFGQASNNGQMIEELNAKSKVVQQFRDVALSLTGRREQKVEKKSALGPLLSRLKLSR